MNSNKGAPKTRRTATQEASYFADREPKKKVKKELKTSAKDAIQDDYMDDYSNSGRSDSLSDGSQSSPNIHGHNASKNDDYDDYDNPKKSGKALSQYSPFIPSFSVAYCIDIYLTHWIIRKEIKGASWQLPFSADEKIRRVN